MKKFLTLMLIVMSFACANAQQYIDTLSHFDSIVLASSEMAAIVDSSNYATPYITTENTNVKVDFTVSNLDTNMTLVVIVNDMMFMDSINGWSSTEWMDTIYDYDNILHIDTIENEGIYYYDTVYAIDTVVVVYDSFPVMYNLFYNGYNTFNITAHGIDTIYRVGIGLVSTNDSGQDTVYLTNVNVYVSDDALAIYSPSVEKVSIYPNPAQSNVTISGECASGTIYDMTGQVIMKFRNTNNINVGSLNRGVYVIRFDTGYTMKLMKM